MNLQEEILKIKAMIISEEERKSKFNKPSQPLKDSIYNYLNLYIKNGNRKVKNKKRNYGNLAEEWCIDGSEEISAYYYFENGIFNGGRLLIGKDLLSSIQRTFSVRQAYAMYVIEEWYDDVMVPKFEETIGEKGLSIDGIDTMSDRAHPCIPEPVKPEGITDQEMIDFIVKNTLYRKDEVLKKLESGEEELEDFYLQILNIVNTKKITGF